MKKFYLTMVPGLVGVILIIAFLNFGNRDEISQDKAYTPKEIWDMQFQKKKEKRKKHYNKADKPDEFTKYFKGITTQMGEEESGYEMNYKIKELNKAKAKNASLKSNNADLNWISRGPANVGGRTRALIIDPIDATHNTWYAGAASGGIWKTTDGGANWTNLADQFSNLSVNAMAMAESDNDRMYAGTGESFPGGTYLMGNGIWTSFDRGTTWDQLSSTIADENFAFTNRLIIDPNDADILLAATEAGIFRSTNGGDTFTIAHNSSTGVEDIVADPTDFNILFAGENSVGVLRSTDAGETWNNSSNGIAAGGRFEIAISNVNHNNIFASVDVTTEESQVYMSTDNGINWVQFDDNQNFLGGQGAYDNTIEAHPYNEDEVFVGGVDMWKLKFNGTLEETEPEILGVYTVNTTFLSFINYSGAFLGGGIDTSDHTNRVQSDWVSVEVRFGPGLKQMAHMFNVPDQSTSGVPQMNYTYIDYVEVPFEVWDITNNKQLMVSFRDQEKDGKFNLYERISDEYGDLGREYIYINSVAYNAAAPDVNIAKTGGHWYKSLYMIWPTLEPGSTWTPENLPVSKIVMDYGTIIIQKGKKTSIADSYGNWGGGNNYDQGAGFGTTLIPGLHPDHHNITIIPTGEPNFTIIDANDGGLGISTDNGVTFKMQPNNYITTQFYGVAKNPEANEYIGGMQDNGTWQSKTGEDATDKSHYLFRIGGDGFECLWHATNPNRMLGSVYNNAIRKSVNKGLNWAYSTQGIASGDGPFLTKLSASKENADLVFAVGNSGVYRSTNFGSSWQNRPITTNWAIDNIVSSYHNVEVSLANGNIVWAGAGMATDLLQLQVSTNEGLTFTAVSNYNTVPMNAYTSGLATHPTEESTAYTMFSLQGKPKVLRTKDLGKTWEDISGFGTNSTSSNGFPDVVANCLLVMPHETNTLWVGTDIGVFESTDNGISWHILDNGLPAVAVYDIQTVGNQVVLATHGRGIWSVDIAEIDNAPYINDLIDSGDNIINISTNFKVAYSKVEVYVNGELNETLDAPSEGSTSISIEITESGLYTTYILGYIGDKSYKSNTIDIEAIYVSISDVTSNDILVYPNPSNGEFKIKLDSDNASIQIFNLSGVLVYSKKANNSHEMNVDISNLNSGSYILRVDSKDGSKIQKILIQK